MTTEFVHGESHPEFSPHSDDHGYDDVFVRGISEVEDAYALGFEDGYAAACRALVTPPAPELSRKAIP